MTTVQALNKLEAEGLLKALLDGGVIPPKIVFYREVYLIVDREIKLGAQKMVAYQYASEKLRVNDRTIRRAVKTMTKTILDKTGANKRPGKVFILPIK